MIDDLGVQYPDLVDLLLRDGIRVTGRGGETREFCDFHLLLTDPAACIVDREGFSEQFMDLELTMLLAGVYDDDRVRELIPRAADLTTVATAYGPRVMPQMHQVCNELREFPDTRRAVVYIGRGGDLGNARTLQNEMPCTCTWQFLIRDEKLHMIVSMRSWDAIWGLSYDIPCFAAVQMAVARHVGLPLGEYRHHAGSFHVYERHYDTVIRSTRNPLALPWLRDEYQATVLTARDRLYG